MEVTSSSSSIGFMLTPVGSGRCRLRDGQLCTHIQAYTGEGLQRLESQHDPVFEFKDEGETMFAALCSSKSWLVGPQPG